MHPFSPVDSEAHLSLGFGNFPVSEFCWRSACVEFCLSFGFAWPWMALIRVPDLSLGFLAWPGTCPIALTFPGDAASWLPPAVFPGPARTSLPRFCGKEPGQWGAARPAGFGCLAPSPLGSSWSFLGPNIHLLEFDHLLQTGALTPATICWVLSHWRCKATESKSGKI